MNIPIKQPETRLWRVKIVLMGISALLAVTPLTGLLNPPKAAAWTGALPGCNQALNTFAGDLKEAIETKDTSFNHNESSFLYARGAADHQNAIDANNYDNMYLYYVNAPNKLKFKKLTATTYGFTAESGTLVNRMHIISREVKTSTYPDGVTTISGVNAPPHELGCVTSAVNVLYSSDWDVYKFTETVYGGTGEAQCSATDIACKISRVFRRVADTFHAVGQAILRGIAVLFAPDSADFNELYTDFTSFFDTKLGFLLYPFQFIGSMFNAYNDTSNQWCTMSNCQKSLGEVYGTEMKLDVLQWRLTAPALFNFLTATLRGLTVLALAFAIHRKYLEVIKK